MKNKKNVLSGVIILLATVIYFPVQAQDVVYQPDVKKSNLFWKAPENQVGKAPKNQHNGLILFNSWPLNLQLL